MIDSFKIRTHTKNFYPINDIDFKSKNSETDADLKKIKEIINEEAENGYKLVNISTTCDPNRDYIYHMHFIKEHKKQI